LDKRLFLGVLSLSELINLGMIDSSVLLSNKHGSRHNLNISLLVTSAVEAVSSRSARTDWRRGRPEIAVSAAIVRKLSGSVGSDKISLVLWPV
jgi:post-segregation antitoxin (ccd killing protein)